jgi:hypothetical protein
MGIKALENYVAAEVADHGFYKMWRWKQGVE